jgi:hypothetical protein
MILGGMFGFAGAAPADPKTAGGGGDEILKDDKIVRIRSVHRSGGGGPATTLFRWFCGIRLM